MTLPANPSDGMLGVVRLGSSPTTDVWLRYNASRSKWVGEQEFTAIRSTDQVGVVLSTTPFTTKRYLPGNSEQPTYSFDAVSPNHCDLAYTAGLSLEYCTGGWLQAPSGATWNVGTYFYQYNTGDANTPTGVFSGGYGTPPTGGAAETAYLSTTSTSRIWREQGWTTLLAPGGGAASLTKTFIYPAMYAYVSTGTTSGTVWDYFLNLRWVI